MNADESRRPVTFGSFAPSACAIARSAPPCLSAIGATLAGCLIFLAGAPASAQCRPPQFRMGQDYGSSVFVSIERRDFTIEKLTCLARTLRRRWSTFGVVFLDSYEAAQNYRGAPVEDIYPKWPEWAKEVHALYSFDASKHEESLEVWPMGENTAPSWSTTIALPIVGAPHCRLEIQNRCLMAAMEKVTYPQEAPETRASGVVMLVGTIGRDGGVSGLRVETADVKPPPGREQLVRAAIQDLKAWQFDAAAHDDPIRIVYSFAIDTARPRGAPPQVRWVSPNQVEVRANPSE